MDSFDTVALDAVTIDTSSHEGGQLAVPGGGWLMGANFVREGYDLVVSGDAGQKFIVMNYFASDTPLDLMTEASGTLQGHVVAQLAGPLAPGQYAQVSQAATTEPIGVVETLQGSVAATRADGTKVTLSQGDPVFRGDIIETGGNGSLSMVMADDSVFSLDADGRVTMDELVYDPEDQEGQMSVTLLKGVFSFVSGQIAKTDPDAMVLNTPLATVGIRGTSGVMNLPEGGSVQIILTPDANGLTGELFVQPKDAAGNPVGDPITVNVPLAAVGVAPGGATQTFNIPAAQFQQQYGAITAQSQNAAAATTTNDDDDGADEDAEGAGTDGAEEGAGEGDETPLDEGIETQGATEAADKQDQSDGAEEEATEQDESAGAEDEAMEQAGETAPPEELIELIGSLLNEPPPEEEPEVAPIEEEEDDEPPPPEEEESGFDGKIDVQSTTNGFNNTFNLEGTSRNDLLSVTIAPPSSNIQSNTIEIAGLNGNDTLSFLLDAGPSDSISGNNVTLLGGEGNDSLWGTISLTSGGEVAELATNNISMIGGLGSDSIQLNIFSTSVDGNDGNTILLDGQYANDTITLDWNAMNNTDGVGSQTGNDVSILGGMGNDTILFDWDIGKTTSTFTTIADIVDNVVFIDGESGDDTITFDWLIQSNTYSSIDRNDVSILGGDGADMLTLTWQMTNASNPTVSSNELYMDGGNGNDMLDLNLLVSGTDAPFKAGGLTLLGGAGMDMIDVDVTFSNLDTNFSNSFHLDGGNSADTLALSIFDDSKFTNNNIFIGGETGNDVLSFSINAVSLISNNVTLAGGSGNDTLNLSFTATGNVSSNMLTLLGGAGDDVFNLMAGASNINNNQLLLDGGLGADTFNLMGDDLATGTSTANAIVFNYTALGDLGDTISGLSSGDNFLMQFGAGSFDSVTSAFHTGTAATNSLHRYIYDNVAFRLLYDADGTGAGAPVVVASFSADVGLTSSNIVIFAP